MNLPPPAKFACQHCGREYSRKYYFTRHEAACGILSKTTKERSLDEEELNDTPTVRQLYDIILDLVAKNGKMEKELASVKQWTETRKRSLNVVDWLNDNWAEGQTYERWFEALVLTADDLDLVFKYDFVVGLIHIMQRLLSLDEEGKLPIKAFEQKDNTLFIRTVEGWKVMSHQGFEQLTGRLSKLIIEQLVKWQDINKNRLDDERFAVEYAEKVQKAIGGSYTKEQYIPRLRRGLYKHLRLNLRNVVQYEFTY